MPRATESANETESIPPPRASYRRARSRTTYSSACPPPRRETSRSTRPNSASGMPHSGEIGQQRDLVAVGELGALEAVGPDLVRKLGLVDPPESQLLEEFGLVGESENARDSQQDRLGDARLDEPGADALPADLVVDRQRADLGEVFPHDV